MINYKLQLITPSEEKSCCATCLHSFVPLDFLLGKNLPEIYCNVNKDRTISGDVLTEPFNYYDGHEMTIQEEGWSKWAAGHKVEFAGICDRFEKVKS